MQIERFTVCETATKINRRRYVTIVERWIHLKWQYVLKDEGSTKQIRTRKSQNAVYIFKFAMWVSQTNAHVNIRHQNLNYLILKSKVIRTFEKAKTFYWSTYLNAPEDLNLQKNRCEKLISRNLLRYFCWRQDTWKTFIRNLISGGLNIINRLFFLSSKIKITSSLFTVGFSSGSTQDCYRLQSLESLCRSC
jgi:hypothetical protein